MPLIMNIPSKPDLTYVITLDNKNYRVRFTWQASNWAWYMTMTTIDGIVITRNAKLVVEQPLLRQNLKDKPSGNIYVVKNIENSDSTAARWNIGDTDKDFSLVYFTEQELLELV